MVNLTTSDKNVLETYKLTIKGLALLLGRQCEFVIHSLENLESSAIAIENGYLSGREIGAPITDRALNFLNSENEDTLTVKVYDTLFTSGKKARSLTVPLRNDKKLIGLLCINMNIDLSIAELSEMFSNVENIKNDNVTNTTEITNQEFFGQSIEIMMQNMIEQYCTEVANDINVPNLEKNKEIILRLKNAGFFNLRGSAENLAQRLSISVQTVYANIRRNS